MQVHDAMADAEKGYIQKVLREKTGAKHLLGQHHLLLGEEALLHIT